MMFSQFLPRLRERQNVEVEVCAPRDVVLRGYLWKRGALNTRFKRRWCVLTSGGDLYYYKSDKHSRYQNFIPLIESVVKWNEASPQFEVTMAERLYIMAAASAIEAGVWVNWLTHFTTRNNSENLSIEQADAFFDKHEGALFAAEEQRLQRQQPPVVSKRPRKVVSLECIGSPPSRDPPVKEALSSTADGACIGEESSSSVVDPCPHLAPGAVPPRTPDIAKALLRPLSFAATGHQEKSRRMRSTSN